jgi:hypothetical protein
MKTPMTMQAERCVFTGNRTFTLKIRGDAFDMAFLRLDAIERRIVGDDFESLSDCLLALETIVRKIEGMQTAAKPRTPAGGTND